MDQATIMRILERQGAANTPDNVNRIIQMMASDPSILERYSLGTAPAQISPGPGRQDIRGGGGMNDNAALLNLMQRVDPQPAAPAAAPPPTAPPPAAAPRGSGAPRQATYPPPREATGSPLQTYPEAPANAPRMSESQTGQGQVDMQVPGMEPAPPPPNNQNSWEWLTALFPALLKKPGGLPVPQGPSGAPQITQQGPEAVYAGKMPRTDVGPQGTPYPGSQRALPAPGSVASEMVVPDTGTAQVGGPPTRPVLPSSNVPQYPSNAPEITKQGIYGATAPPVRAEVDAENAQARALQEQMLERERAQQRTRETSDAAKESQRRTDPRAKRPAKIR